MSNFYKSNVQSYSSYYSQDPDGQVHSATQKYVVDDNNGKKRGKIHREMGKPGRQDSYTRNLKTDEIHNLFGYGSQPQLPFREQVEEKLAQGRSLSRNRRRGGDRTRSSREEQLVNYQTPSERIRDRNPFHQMDHFATNLFRDLGKPFKDDPFFKDF